VLMGAYAGVLPGFLGEGDAITKAIQDARQLLHGHSGAMEGSLSNPYRKVRGARRVVTVPLSNPTISDQSGVSIRGSELVPDSPLSCQDHVGIDSSPVKERVEETPAHRLDEALLTCEMDGEDGWEHRTVTPPPRLAPASGS